GNAGRKRGKPRAAHQERYGHRTAGTHNAAHGHHAGNAQALIPTEFQGYLFRADPPRQVDPPAARWHRLRRARTRSIVVVAALLPRTFLRLLSGEHVECHHDSHQVVAQRPAVGNVTGIYRGHHVAQCLRCSRHGAYPPLDGVRPPLVTRHPPSLGPPQHTPASPGTPTPPRVARAVSKRARLVRYWPAIPPVTHANAPGGRTPRHGRGVPWDRWCDALGRRAARFRRRSEEHTSELQ